MAINKDFADLLHLLNSVRAKYLIVGAYAVIFYTEPRYTKDIDIWIEPTPENAQKVYQALQRFGAPVKNLSVKVLTNPNMVYQIGMAPNRIDILMGLGRFPFDRAWKGKRASRYGKERVYFLSQKDLVRVKRETGRPQDQLDVQALSRATRNPR